MKVAMMTGISHGHSRVGLNLTNVNRVLSGVCRLGQAEGSSLHMDWVCERIVVRSLSAFSAFCIFFVPYGTRSLGRMS